jgi:transposase-like protein
MVIGGSAMKSKLEAAHFASEEAAIAYVENRLWPDGPVCPHCGTIGEARRSVGKTTRAGLWNCRACREPFTVKIGTIFESSHIPMRIWLQAIYLMSSSKKGISTRQLHRTFGGSLKTAWFLGHRVREAMTVLNLLDSSPIGGSGSNQLGGENQVVEADETFVGGKARNRKNKIPAKAPVLSLVERDGRVRSFRVQDVTAQSLKPIIVSHVNKATYLMTDDAPVYWPIGGVFAGHGTVNHSAEEYVRAAFWHTNTVENFFSIFKRGIYGCYFHVSEAHLHRYAAEFDFRHNHREGLGYDDLARADRILTGAVGKRLTYETTRRQRAVEAPPF